MKTDLSLACNTHEISSPKSTIIATRPYKNVEPILVSICCIAYNQEKYIADAIESFLMQEVSFGVEILIHDDASTDRTADIIRDYSDRYPSLIKPILQEENQYSLGKSPNVIFNFPRAHGKYIAMCEGDDFWSHPQKLQIQVQHMEANPETGMVFTDVTVFRQNSGSMSRRHFRNRSRYRRVDLINHIANKYYLAPPTWLIRTDLLKKIKYRDVSDGSFIIALELLRKSKVDYLDMDTATYRVLSESASHSRNPARTFRYRLGVFRIQQRYCQQYFPARKICLQVDDNGYASLVNLAKQVGDEDFVRQAYRHFEKRPYYVRVIYRVLYANRFIIFVMSRLWRLMPYSLTRKKTPTAAPRRM